jgi:hypothetical protein
MCDVSIAMEVVDATALRPHIHVREAATVARRSNLEDYAISISPNLETITTVVDLLSKIDAARTMADQLNDTNESHPPRASQAPLANAEVDNLLPRQQGWRMAAEAPPRPPRRRDAEESPVAASFTAAPQPQEQPTAMTPDHTARAHRRHPHHPRGLHRWPKGMEGHWRAPPFIFLLWLLIF